MTRPVQPIGTFGTIAVKKVRERTFYASTRFRAYDGGYIRFSATGPTDGAAQRELKRKLADYTEAQHANGITSRSPLSVVATIWLHEVGTAERLSPQTIDAYADNLRTVLSEVMALAVRHDAIRANPVQMTGPLKKPRHEVKVLSIDELTHIRRIIAEWRTAGTVMGPKPDGQLALIFGTGARIGEALAIRARDVDLSAPTVTISGPVLGIGGRENAGASVLDGGCAAVVDVERGVHSDAGVAMLVVVPVVEFGADCACMPGAPERPRAARRKPRVSATRRGLRQRPNCLTRG